MSASAAKVESSPDALALFNRINNMLEPAQDFQVPIAVYTDAARRIMGEDPRKTFNEADEDRRAKLKSHMEVLSKMAISMLGKKEVEYYTAEFHRRAEHFEEETLSDLQNEVKRVSEEALKIFSNQKEHSAEEFWTTYQESIPYIMAAANLVSRQVAFSNIVVNAKHKEEVRGSSKHDVEALLERAKTALKLDNPKEMIPTDRIAAIESELMEAAGRL